MSKESARYIQVGEWVFEVKTVRALRVDEYGKPYSAIANCNLNGNSMYIDGLLTKDDQEFSKEDFLTFHKFSEKMGLDSFSYHRYQNGQSVTKDVKVQSFNKSIEPSAQANIKDQTNVKIKEQANVIEAFEASTIKTDAIEADVVEADVVETDRKMRIVR